MHKVNGIMKIRFLYYHKHYTHISLVINIDVKYLKDEREMDGDTGWRGDKPVRVKCG